MTRIPLRSNHNTTVGRFVVDWMGPANLQIG